MRTVTNLIRKSPVVFLSLLAAALPLMAETQKQPDQTYLLEGSPDRIEIPKELKTPGGGLVLPTSLTQATVETLLTSLLNSKGVTTEAAGCPSRTSPDTYYVLHLVRHETGEPSTRNDAWYVYTCAWTTPSGRMRMNDPEIVSHYKQARMLGAKKLSLLYLHYGVPTGQITEQNIEQLVRTAWTNRLPPATSAEPEVNSERLKLFWASFEMANGTGLAWVSENSKPTFVSTAYAAERTASVAEIDRLAKVLVPKWVAEFRTNGDRIAGPRGKRLAPLGTASSDTAFYVEEDFLPITYKIDILKKNPIWQEDLRTIASQFGLQSGSFISVSVPMQPAALFNAALDLQVSYPTSDIAITGIRGGAADAGNAGKAIGTKTYDNERMYWFDLGFVVPFKSVKELKFNSDDKLVQAKPVEKNRIYATAGFFPFGSVNTKADKLFRLSPTIIYGMSLDKTPWNHQLVGVGLGLKWVQPFVGLSGTRSALAAADGSIDGYRWGWRLTYGLQIPTSAITGAIKKSN